MNKKEKTTPIILKRENKKFKLMYITYEDDGSIYITFPRKKGYILIEQDEFGKLPIGVAEHYHSKSHMNYENSKISFVQEN